MLNRLFGGIAKGLGLRIATTWVRDIAEGKKGPKLKSLYWSLTRRKTVTGLLLAVGCAVSAALGYVDIATWLGAVAVPLTSWGLVDKAWRSALPAWLAQSNIYRLLAQFSGELTALLAASLYAVQSGVCPDWFGWSCNTWTILIVSVGAALVQLGLVDAAWRSKKPIGG